MLRRLKKFTVYSSLIVAGQASRALDDAPFAGQDESEDAKGLLRQLSECGPVQIFGKCYDPATTTFLRFPSASPTPGAARDRPSTSQVAQQHRVHRPDPDRDRPAHESGSPASSPRVPDARIAARPPLGVAGASGATRSTARSRPRSASSRR